MLATLHLPDRYDEWNRRWHAPQGPGRLTYLPPFAKISRRKARALGPLVWQPTGYPQLAQAFVLRKPTDR